jgi:hypothetical protein
LSSSPPKDEGLDELWSPECPHDGAGFDGAGLGVAQLEVDAGGGDGSAAGATGFGAAGLAARTAFFAGLLLAAAFLADFFGAAAFDFLADFFADLVALFVDLFADFFDDFFADFFFAVTARFLPLLLFLPAFFFLPLAIMNLLLSPIRVYRALPVVRLKRGAVGSIGSWPGTACRPIEKLNRVHHRN